ncbi:hypothetical protein [Psychrobacillus sp.]|uniref:hypothetical protein n=1 Tax=Psychrobacillus sp. TaxID=1871623 RepID=UPI0028BE9587|nr:hypothetical protein [Psychrobacillus sp.]
MNDYVNVLKNFLPQSATILELQQPQGGAAILLADIDGDLVEELIGVYKYEEQNYILILKSSNNQWLPLIHIKGGGYGITDLLAVPITNSWVNTLVVGWQIGSMWSELDLLQWTDSGFVKLPTNNMVYSKLEVEDMPGQYGQDGQYEMAVWIHDTGEAYKVEVYRFSETGLVLAKDVYPYYFKKVAAYYQKLLQTNDFSFYWYYLSDAQKKSGDLEEDLFSVDKALSFRSPYPSKEMLLSKREQVLNDLESTTQTIIDSKRGDVTGDGFRDIIYLMGDKTEESPFWQNITLVIMNERTNLHESIPLKENAGYNPTIFLGDFTGNHVDDILIVIDTGGSGGIIYAYVFSFLEGKMQQVFDVDAYNERHKYEVNYQNNFKATVVSASPSKKYTLDLMYKGKEYLSEIYNENGTLKDPIEGWVDPVGGLYPVDYARSGTYELMALQKIAGRYHADGLGYVENVLQWNGYEFVTDRQSVAIFGEDLPLPTCQG